MRHPPLQRGGLVSLLIGGCAAGLLVAWLQDWGLAALWWLLPLVCAVAWALSRVLHLALGQLLGWAEQVAEKDEQQRE
jgi:hypothetical protein